MNSLAVFLVGFGSSMLAGKLLRRRLSPTKLFVAQTLIGCACSIPVAVLL